MGLRLVRFLFGLRMLLRANAIVFIFSLASFKPEIANAACTSPAAGIGALDFQSGVFKYCDGTNWQSLGGSTTDASLLTSGTLADARLSTNVPLKNTSNTFTDTNIFNVPTTTKEALILKTSDDNTTKNLFETQNSSGTVKTSISATGVPSASTDLTTKSYVDTSVGNYVLKAGDTMTGALVNTTNSASTALKVTQSGAGHAATFTGGNVGIGTTNPTGTFQVAGGTAAAATNGSSINITAQNAGSGNQNGGNINLTAGTGTGTGADGRISLYGQSVASDYKVAPTTDRWGLYAQSNPAGAASTGKTFYGVIGETWYTSTGDGTQTAIGVNGTTSWVSGSGLGTSIAGKFSASTSMAGLVLPTAKAGDFSVTSAFANKITNGYGVYVGNIQAVNPYSIFASDTTATSYFGGNVGIGTSTPTSKLNVNGTLKIGDGGETCPAIGAGGLKWNGTAMQFCDGTSWANIDAGGGGGDFMKDGSVAMTGTLKMGSNTQVIYLPNQTNFTGTVFYGNGGGSLSHSSGVDGFYNTGVGIGALSAVTTGSYNTATGNAALAAATTGIANTAYGYNALTTTTSGFYNTAIGYNALTATTSGGSNTAVGKSSLGANTTGASNTAIGTSSLQANTTGNNNTGSGVNALGSITTGSDNVGVGLHAGFYISGGSTANQTSGTSVYLGNSTKALADGDANEIVIGYNATGIGSNTVMLGNSSITKTALQGNVGIGTTNPSSKLEVSGGDAIINNVRVGQGPGTSGNSNVVLGTSALNSNVGGGFNTAIGTQAMYNQTNATYNTAVGVNSGIAITTASYNTYIGNGSGYNQTGAANTALGNNALYGAPAASGANNVALGNSAGYNITNGSNNIVIGSYNNTGGVTTGSNNIIMGNDVRPPSQTASGQLNIGNLIYATGLATGTTASTGYVGIGTSTPTSALNVSGTLKIGDGGELCTAVGAGGLKWNGSAIQFCNGTAWANLGGGTGDITNGGNSTGAEVSIGTNDTQKLNFRTNGAKAMTIATNGYVGIGTTSPGYRFVVDSSGSSQVAGLFAYDWPNSNSWINGLQVQNSATSADGARFELFHQRSGAGAPLQAGDTVGDILFRGTDSAWASTEYGKIRTLATNVTSGSSMGQMIFSTLKNGTGTDQMAILGNGNVGIGTTNPGTTLQINGTTTVKGVTETVVAGGTCSTSYNIDAASGTMFTLTLNGACAIGISNLAAGQSFTVKLTQSSTTAPTFAAAYKWPGGTQPTWSTAATKYDVLACASFDGTTLQCSGMIDVR